MLLKTRSKNNDIIKIDKTSFALQTVKYAIYGTL